MTKDKNMNARSANVAQATQSAGVDSDTAQAAPAVDENHGYFEAGKFTPAQIRTQEVDDLMNVLAQLDTADAVFELFEDMFTIREIRETSQRLAVARMLDAGKSYAAIEKATGASATTIARVSKCLTYGTGGYRRALDVLE